MHQIWTKGTRYYSVRLERDLFGAWVVTRTWGRIGTSMGRIRSDPASSFEEGLSQIEAIEKNRVSHGYTRIQQGDRFT
ncbi:MAG: WGR domain-containing protein [Candidatus Sedimenticola sp. (ex Thyasira tokunagai)]